MSDKITILIQQTGSVYVGLDRDDYIRARNAHSAGNVAWLDRLLDSAISGMDTEITITEQEPPHASYDL